MRILPKGKMQLMEHDALGVVGPAILFCQTTIYVKALFINECSLFSTLQTKAFHGYEIVSIHCALVWRYILPLLGLVLAMSRLLVYSTNLLIG